MMITIRDFLQELNIPLESSNDITRPAFSLNPGYGSV